VKHVKDNVFAQKDVTLKFMGKGDEARPVIALHNFT